MRYRVSRVIERQPFVQTAPGRRLACTEEVEDDPTNARNGEAASIVCRRRWLEFRTVHHRIDWPGRRDWSALARIPLPARKQNCLGRQCDRRDRLGCRWGCRLV